MSQILQALIVPVEVFGFAVNQKDAVESTAYFSGANAVFTGQTLNHPAFLGANVNRDLTGPPAQPLEPGIHVHWRLPSYFGKADSSSGSLVFRAAPNRWLVSRFVLNGGTATRTSWVVLSDNMNDIPPANQTVVTLPTHRTASALDYQYVGGYQPFSAAWREPSIPSAQQFATQTGMPLTSVANGQPAFATYYPNCRGVFGFADPLDDMAMPVGTSVQIVYAVIGWFSDALADPLAGGLELADIQQRIGWTFEDGGSTAVPNQSLFYGQVQGIAWHPSHTYLPSYVGGPPTVPLDVSLGNSPPEALSCYLQNAIHPSLPSFQTLLNGYLEGQLAKFGTPQPNQLAALYDALQEARFRTREAGDIYGVFKTTGPATPTAGASGLARKLVDLPPLLGDALNILNVRAQRLQMLKETLQSFHSQLYADWYRIFKAKPADQQTCYDIAYAKYAALGDLTDAITAAQADLDNQRTVVEALVPMGYELREVPAPRYWQPGDPVFILAADEVPFTPRRIGRAGSWLPCRLQGQFVTAASSGGVDVTAASLQASGLPAGNALPNPDVFQALTLEALLLNAGLLSARTGAAITGADIDAALAGTSKVLTLTGTPPAAAAVTLWNGNPWIPQYVRWRISFQPVFATADSSGQEIVDYSADFFTSRFLVDQNQGGAIAYTPPANPATQPFSQEYSGMTLLSAGTLDAMVTLLGKGRDPILTACFQALQGKFLAAQSFGGLTAGFLMQDLAMQLNIRVPDGSEYADITDAIAQELGGFRTESPDFQSFYNPIRSGYMKAEFLLVDAFGQQLAVQPQTVTVAESLMATYQGSALPGGIAFLPPRLAQASRLNFRFLSADATNLEEMNDHPATTPICGWVLPNHLSESLFFYDAQGASLGYLYLKDDGSEVLWQSAPGNDWMIDEDAATVMADQQPQLRDLVLYLQTAPGFFHDFIRAIDNVNGFVEAVEVSTNNSLAVLVGRPLALVQVALGLQLRGTPLANQSWSVLSLHKSNDDLSETDSGLTGVNFPVMLGNLANINDGLIGYFKSASNAYDLTNFYSEGAAPSATSRVQVPGQNTVTLTAFPSPNGSGADTATQKLLMLIDPRARVHAATGILPTKNIRIPPELYADTLRALEMAFLTAPVLGGDAFALPLPDEPGYSWSWVQEKQLDNANCWVTRSDVQQATNSGPSSYGPQTVLEGWLRLNPDLLQFVLQQADGTTALNQGVNNMTLVLINRQNRAITFRAGLPVAEGKPPAGSVFYIHFDAAFPPNTLSGVALSASGWSFRYYEDAGNSGYWAASTTSDVTVEKLGQLQIRVDGLTVATPKPMASLTFDYESIENLNDGVYRDVLSVAPPN